MNRWSRVSSISRRTANVFSPAHTHLISWSEFTTIGRSVELRLRMTTFRLERDVYSISVVSVKLWKETLRRTASTFSIEEHKKWGLTLPERSTHRHLWLWILEIETTPGFLPTCSKRWVVWVRENASGLRTIGFATACRSFVFAHGVGYFEFLGASFRCYSVVNQDLEKEASKWIKCLFTSTVSIALIHIALFVWHNKCTSWNCIHTETKRKKNTNRYIKMKG